MIIVDGAHNPAGAKALVDSLKELGISEPTFILGFQGYKDIDSMLDVYALYAGNIIFTRSSHPQAFDPALDPKYSPRYIRDIKLAIKEAKKIGKPIVIAGSLFVVADAFKLLDVGVNT